MSISSRRCQACGCEAASSEGFQVLRANQDAVAASRAPAAESVLCANCSAEWLRSGDFELAYQFCEQCAAPVESDQMAIRSKTHTTQAGLLAYHQPVVMSLCPNCAKAYDGTGRSLIMGVGFLLGGIALIALIGWLFG